MSDNPITPEASIPLDEFCQDVSRSDRRVELLAVFAFRERQAGRHHDMATAYAERFAGTHDSPTAGNVKPASM